MLPLSNGDTGYAVILFDPDGVEIKTDFTTLQWGLSSSSQAQPTSWFRMIKYSCNVDDAPVGFYYDEDYGAIPYYVSPEGCGDMIAIGATWLWVKYENWIGYTLIQGREGGYYDGAYIAMDFLFLEGGAPPTPGVADVTYSGSTSATYESGSTHFTISGSTEGDFSISSSSPWAVVSGYSRTGLLTGQFDIVYGQNTGSTRSSVITITLTSGNTFGSTSFTFTQATEPGPEVITSLTVNVPASVIDTGRATYEANPDVPVSIVWTSSDTSKAIISSSGDITVIAPGVVVFTATDTISSLSASGQSTVSVSLPEPDNFPVWRDEVFTYNTDGYYDYNILINGAKVYSGRNHLINGVDTGIYVNDIAKDFVENHFEIFPGNWSPTNYSVLLEVEIDDTVVANYRFYKDYSYEVVEGSIIPLNDPIRNEVPAGCIIPFCFLSVDGTSSGITTPSGTLNLESHSSGFYNVVASSGTYNVGGTIYKTIDSCNDEVLYYENAFGGWDVFVPKWVRKKTDNITSFSLDQAYNNNTRQYENRRYLNIASASWEFNTGWLTNEQSSKMHHLIESNNVYLYKGGRYIPVVVTDSTLEYKTWCNNGKKPINYTISIKESWGKERR